MLSLRNLFFYGNSYGFVTFENHEDAERIMRKEV